MCLKYACVSTEHVIQVSQGGQSDSVTWWALVEVLLQRPDNFCRAVWATQAGQGAAGIIQIFAWHSYRVTRFEAFLVIRFHFYTSFRQPRETDRCGTRECRVRGRECEPRRENIRKNSNGMRQRWKEKEEGTGGGRKRLLKCEFSAAKATRAASLPVIGLAPFPKNPFPPLPSVSCFPIQPPSCFPCRPAPIYATVSRSLLEHGKAGGIVLAEIAACGRLLQWIDWERGVKRQWEWAYTKVRTMQL